MSSCVLLLSFLVPTAATFVRVDQWHIQQFSASGCNAANKVEDDYKELGVCNQKDATTWQKAVGNATTYTRKEYTDNACTIEKAGMTPEILNAACTANGAESEWYTGAVVTTLDTFRRTGPYTDSACTTMESGVYGADYHAMNTCQQTAASSSIKYVCTATAITKEMYSTKDCTGTVDATCGGTAWECESMTSGDTCAAYNNPSKQDKFRKVNCGPIPPTAGSTSKAWRLCSYGLVQFLVGATFAAVMSF